jgi:hypothetical protein
LLPTARLNAAFDAACTGINAPLITAVDHSKIVAFMGKSASKRIGGTEWQAARGSDYDAGSRLPPEREHNRPVGDEHA